MLVQFQPNLDGRKGEAAGPLVEVTGTVSSVSGAAKMGGTWVFMAELLSSSSASGYPAPGPCAVANEDGGTERGGGQGGGGGGGRGTGGGQGGGETERGAGRGGTERGGQEGGTERGGLEVGTGRGTGGGQEGGGGGWTTEEGGPPLKRHRCEGQRTPRRPASLLFSGEKAMRWHPLVSAAARDGTEVRVSGLRPSRMKREGNVSSGLSFREVLSASGAAEVVLLLVPSSPLGGPAGVHCPLGIQPLSGCRRKAAPPLSSSSAAASSAASRDEGQRGPDGVQEFRQASWTRLLVAAAAASRNHVLSAGDVVHYRGVVSGADRARCRLLLDGGSVGVLMVHFPFPAPDGLRIGAEAIIRNLQVFASAIGGAPELAATSRTSLHVVRFSSSAASAGRPLSWAPPPAAAAAAAPCQHYSFQGAQLTLEALSALIEAHGSLLGASTPSSPNPDAAARLLSAFRRALGQPEPPSPRAPQLCEEFFSGPGACPLPHEAAAAEPPRPLLSISRLRSAVFSALERRPRRLPSSGGDGVVLTYFSIGSAEVSCGEGEALLTGVLVSRGGKLFLEDDTGAVLITPSGIAASWAQLLGRLIVLKAFDATATQTTIREGPQGGGGAAGAPGSTGVRHVRHAWSVSACSFDVAVLGTPLQQPLSRAHAAAAAALDGPWTVAVIVRPAEQERHQGHLSLSCVALPGSLKLLGRNSLAGATATDAWTCRLIEPREGVKEEEGGSEEDAVFSVPCNGTPYLLRVVLTEEVSRSSVISLGSWVALRLQPLGGGAGETCSARPAGFGHSTSGPRSLGVGLRVLQFLHRRQKGAEPVDAATAAGTPGASAGTTEGLGKEPRGGTWRVALAPGGLHSLKARVASLWSRAPAAAAAALSVRELLNGGSVSSSPGATAMVSFHGRLRTLTFAAESHAETAALLRCPLLLLAREGEQQQQEQLRPLGGIHGCNQKMKVKLCIEDCLTADKVDLYIDLSSGPELPPSLVEGAWVSAFDAHRCVSGSTSRVYTKALGCARLHAWSPREPLCPHGCCQRGQSPGTAPLVFPLPCCGDSGAAAMGAPAPGTAQPEGGPRMAVLQGASMLSDLPSIDARGLEGRRKRRRKGQEEGAAAHGTVRVHARVRTLQHLELRLGGSREEEAPPQLEVSAWALLDDGSAVAEAWLEGGVAWGVLGLRRLRAAAAKDLPRLQGILEGGLPRLQQHLNRQWRGQRAKGTEPATEDLEDRGLAEVLGAVLVHGRLVMRLQHPRIDGSGASAAGGGASGAANVPVVRVQVPSLVAGAPLRDFSELPKAAYEALHRLFIEASRQPVFRLQCQQIFPVSGNGGVQAQKQQKQSARPPLMNRNFGDLVGSEDAADGEGKKAPLRQQQQQRGHGDVKKVQVFAAGPAPQASQARLLLQHLRRQGL